MLVYAPGGSTGVGWFPPGTVADIATDAMWRSMTTSDFGQYDVIYIAGGRCSGTTDSVMGTADDTVGVWGPAVRGRILLTHDDADLHGGSAAMLFHRNLIGWLKGSGRNGTGGRTSLYMSWGCTLQSGAGAGGYTPGARGTPERFTAALGSPLLPDLTNFCDSVAVTPAGSTHPVLAGIPPFWSCPFHTGFASPLPPGYVSIVQGTTGGMGSVAAVRESPVPCVP